MAFKICKKYRKYTFIKRSVIWGEPQYAYDVSNFSIILCLQYARNNRIIEYGEGLTRNHHSRNSETAI